MISAKLHATLVCTAASPIIPRPWHRGQCADEEVLGLLGDFLGVSWPALGKRLAVGGRHEDEEELRSGEDASAWQIGR